MNTNEFITRFESDDVVLSALRNALQELDFLVQETTIRLTNYGDIIDIDQNVTDLICSAIHQLEKGK